MANQFLGLSLFVMLLSFFIVLCSMSSYEEERSKPILNSLAVAFSTSNQDHDLEPSVQKDPDTSYKQGSTLDRIKGLFKSQIAGVKIQKNRLGTIMQVRMSQEQFESSILDPLSTPDMEVEESFATFLVSVMNTATGVPYRMDIILTMDEDPMVARETDSEKFMQVMKKSALYAQRMEEAGLPAYQLSAGLNEGGDGMVDLVFRPYVRFNPLGGDD